MANTLIGRKRIRKFFGKIKEVAEMPNLIEVQKASYDQFLMVEEPKGGRPEEGLQAVFKSVFPISDFSNTALLEFVKYTFEPPKYDVDECRQRGMTFAAPLKVTLRLIVFDVDPDTGARSVKDIKEQDVYIPDAPFAGRVLRPRQGQDPFFGQAAVRRAHHPVPRFLARHRVRRQGHRLCPYRPEA
jgi:DNA-directed RNA polymerase subunit beta